MNRYRGSGRGGHDLGKQEADLFQPCAETAEIYILRHPEGVISEMAGNIEYCRPIYVVCMVKIG
jgi:hypothetical protein